MTVLTEHETTPAPQVTVAVAFCNCRDFILDCLDSARTQTIPALDLVVVDDGSQDGGAEDVRNWFESHRARFARTTIVRHETSQGLAASRNAAFAGARTEYVFVLDGDRLIYPRCLQQLAAALDRTAASFSYCYLEKFGADIGLRNVDEWQPPGPQRGTTIDGMVMMRRRVWQAIEGYATDMPAPGWEDFELWCRIAAIGGSGVRVPEVLGRYRVHMTPMVREVPAARIDEMRQYIRRRHPQAFGITEAPSGR